MASRMSTDSRIEDDEKLFKYSKCGEKYKHEPSLSRYAVSCFSKQTFDCSNCDKSFNRKDNLVRHQVSCKGRIEWKCQKCDKVFQYQAYLKRHKCADRCSTCHVKLREGKEHVCRNLIVKLPIPASKPKRELCAVDPPSVSYSA